MVARVRAIFFDLDGVLVDPARTLGEWDRLVGEYFARAFGGEAVSWGRANRELYPALVEAHVQRLDDPLRSETAYGIEWVRRLCRAVGVPPPSRTNALRHWRAAETHVCAHTTALHPAARGVIDTLQQTHALHTASGNCSWRVDALLAQLGALHTFRVRFGPDRAHAAKHTPRFYERAFAAAGVAPSQALVVDDAPRQLALAAGLGARTALIDPARPQTAFDLVLAHIEELPGALAAPPSAPHA